MKKKILKHLVHNGRKSSPQLAEELGLSLPTVNKYLYELLATDLILECGKEDSQRGRKPMIYKANPHACYFAGVDINQYSLRVMLSDLEGNTLREECLSEDSFHFENTPRIMETVCSFVKRFLDAEPAICPKIKMVGFNISGRVDSTTGVSHSMFNFEDDDAPLAERLSKRIGYPVTIENNTRAMTFGEQFAGALKGRKNALYINFSWGFALGIVIDGKLYRGMSGYAGESGHIHAYDNNVMCHCGKVGCLETEASISAIARHLHEEVTKGTPSIISQLSRGRDITPGMIAEALEREDPLTMEVVERCGTELGRHISGLINIFNPEALVIGGTDGLHLGYFYNSVRQAITKYSLRLLHKDMKVELSPLNDRAGVVGACMVARHNYFKNEGVI